MFNIPEQPSLQANSSSLQSNIKLKRNLQSTKSQTQSQTRNQSSANPKIENRGKENQIMSLREKIFKLERDQKESEHKLASFVRILEGYIQKKVEQIKELKLQMEQIKEQITELNKDVEIINGYQKKPTHKKLWREVGKFQKTVKLTQNKNNNIEIVKNTHNSTPSKNQKNSNRNPQRHGYAMKGSVESAKSTEASSKGKKPNNKIRVKQ